MSVINSIFGNIEKLTREDGQEEFLKSLVNINSTNSEETNSQNKCNAFHVQKAFLEKIINEIDNLSNEIKKNETILISVKNQKLLRSCFQIITSVGISPNLITGLGVKLSKRCLSASLLPDLNFDDKQKYKMLVLCTDFFERSYSVPVLKKVIMTLHFSDYLAALIQLSFAPLKKPGVYNNFVMTKELFDTLTKDRSKYVQIYNYLVINCFQPTLMKELLVLQGVTEPSPPMFVRRVLTRELSRRLLASGGLLSLIRCLMESYSTDPGLDWKQMDMICKIISAKHGNEAESMYLSNISSQISQILSTNNLHYLNTAVACILCLNEKYPFDESVKTLFNETFNGFDYNNLINKTNLPGTLILSSQEIEHRLNILNVTLSLTHLTVPYSLLSCNLYILFFLGIKCTNEQLKLKLKDIFVKCFQNLTNNEISAVIIDCLFGKVECCKISIEEYNSGLLLKYITVETKHNKEDALSYFLCIFKSLTNIEIIQNVLETCLMMAIDLNDKRNVKITRETLMTSDDVPVLIDEIDEQYIVILQLLSEISSMPRVITALKLDPHIALNFVEHFILKTKVCAESDDECVTIAIVLLNIILSDSKQPKEMENRFSKLIPVLTLMSQHQSTMRSVLCKEALMLIYSENKIKTESKFGKAITDAFDDLLPVRAHGLIALTKLIESNDTETLSKKHYVLCLFQEQLKDTDSYIYLAAINGIASLGTYCPEEVLHVLCKEFLQTSTNNDEVDTKDTQTRSAELRMKIGDIIVKVTKRLGEMVIVHKTLLLNTMLCASRDQDPLIRTSALSNLAEIALALHYKMGSIIYELLYCIWDILETDKAIECRRAALMIISSLIKGLGKDVLVQLKDDLLPIYRTLKKLYHDVTEDTVLRLHAQIALEELNDIVQQFMFPEITMEKKIFVLNTPNDILK